MGRIPPRSASLRDVAARGPPLPRHVVEDARDELAVVPAVAGGLVLLVPQLLGDVARDGADVGLSLELEDARVEGDAEQGWAALRGANRDLLGDLRSEIRRVEVAGKGTYYRLFAGPVPPSEATALCRALNKRGVFCSPAG